MAPLKYKHIIWDWNGTLFDDAWLCVDITSGLLRERGLPELTIGRYQGIFDFPVRVYYERLGFDLERESFEELGSEFIDAYRARRFECRLQKDAVRVLEALKQEGITQSILSAYEQDSLAEVVTHFGLGDYFIRLVGLDDHYAHGKAQLGKEWIETLHYAPREVLMVGDTVHDHEVTVEMGTDCVLIPSGHHTQEKLKRCGVPVLPSLAAFLRKARL